MKPVTIETGPTKELQAQADALQARVSAAVDAAEKLEAERAKLASKPAETLTGAELQALQSLPMRQFAAVQQEIALREEISEHNRQVAGAFQELVTKLESDYEAKRKNIAAGLEKLGYRRPAEGFGWNSPENLGAYSPHLVQTHPAVREIAIKLDDARNRTFESLDAGNRAEIMLAKHKLGSMQARMIAAAA